MKVLQRQHEEMDELRPDIGHIEACCRQRERVERRSWGSGFITQIILWLACGSGRKKLERGTTVQLNVQRGDNVIFETFGMRICTEEISHEDGTCTCVHRVRKIIKDGPAHQLQIKKGDEIILIGDNFVPFLNHRQLLELFRSVKVDGKSTFSLLLHRSKRRSSKLWVDTRAVLAPDKVDKDKRPVLKNSKVYKSRLSVYEVESKNIYQMSGTETYLEIGEDDVIADVMTGTESDKQKIICKMTRISQNVNEEPIWTYEAALCDSSKKRFICINQSDITLQDHPEWFKVTMRGGEIHFLLKDLYLAYDATDNIVSPAAVEYWFKEYSADAMVLHMNASASHAAAVRGTVNKEITPSANNKDGLKLSASQLSTDLEVVTHSVEVHTSGNDDESFKNAEEGPGSTLNIPNHVSHSEEINASVNKQDSQDAEIIDCSCKEDEYTHRNSDSSSLASSLEDSVLTDSSISLDKNEYLDTSALEKKSQGCSIEKKRKNLLLMHAQKSFETNTLSPMPSFESCSGDRMCKTDSFSSGYTSEQNDEISRKYSCAYRVPLVQPEDTNF